MLFVHGQDAVRVNFSIILIGDTFQNNIIKLYYAFLDFCMNFRLPSS